MVDAVSVSPSSILGSSKAPTSHRESEDRFAIDSGHWRRLQFQSKNKYTSSMIDRLSVTSSTMMSESSYYIPSMSASADVQSASQTAQTMTAAAAAAGNNISENNGGEMMH